MDGVIGGVARLKTLQAILRPVDDRIANAPLMAVRQAGVQGGLKTREIQAFQIGRDVVAVGNQLHVVDHVGLTRMEHCRIGLPVPAGIPHHSALIAPAGFWFQIWISLVGRVGVVEIGIGGNAEAAANGALELPSRAQNKARRNGGREFAVATVELFTGAERKRKAPQRSRIEVDIARAMIPRVLTQVVAVDGVVKALATERESGVRGKFSVQPQRELEALVDVVILVDAGIVAEQDELVRMAAVAEVEFCILADSLPQPGKPGLGALKGVAIAVELVGP